jgi:hypothetical protein
MHQEVAEHRVPAQLAAGEMEGEAAGGPVRGARLLDQRRPTVTAAASLIAMPARAPRPRRCLVAGTASARVVGLRPGRGDALEQRRQHGQHHRLPGLRPRRIAVVQEEDVAAAQAAAEPRQHPVRLAPHRVVAAAGPAHQLQVEPFEHRREQGIAQARRSAEEARRDADQVGEPRLRRADLARQAARAEQREGARMPIAVVLHAVAAADNLAAERGVTRGDRGDREERGAGPVRIEDVEHGGRDLGVGAVVDGDRDLVPRRGRFGQAGPVAAQPARARPESASRSAPGGWRRPRPAPRARHPAAAARRRRRRHAPRRWP